MREKGELGLDEMSRIGRDRRDYENTEYTSGESIHCD